MALENPWVTYLYRSYKSIKAAILARMQTVVPEITDHSESNIFVIIINSFAGLVEQLNYYIDSVARESYISTARRYSSLVKLTRLIDYRVRAKVGSVVDLKITAVDSSGNPVLLQADNTLNADLIIKDSAGVEFITQHKVTIFAGSSSAIVGARQRVQVTDDNIGTTTSAADQAFQLGADYQHDTATILINAVSWSRVNTFAFSGPLDKHFIVEVDQNQQAWVVFGDDTNGDIPPSGQSVLATYFTCEGVAGNVEANTLITWDTPSGGPTPPVQTPTIDSYEVNNELPAVGGQDEEDIEGIRKHASLSLRTLDRAVTLQDHNDICMLVPGVGKAATDFDVHKKEITFYIAPDEGGIAQGSLLTDVEDYFDNKKMISTVVNAVAAGETLLRITLNVTVKFRRSTTQAETDIKEALENEFGFNNSEVNRKIRRSDIIALIDNLDKVDYLSLDILTTKPYPRTTVGSNPLTTWLIEVQSNTVEIALWRIAVIDPANGGNGYARVYRTGPSGVEEFDGQLTIYTTPQGTTDYTSDDGTLKLSMWGTGFSIADEWQFKTYPYNEDHELEDFTIPIYDETELSLTVNEQVGV
jgi:hypothetical protein